MVVVPYTDSVHDAVSFPLSSQKNICFYGNLYGAADPAEYNGNRDIWDLVYGQGLYVNLHVAKSFIFLVHVEG